MISIKKLKSTLNSAFKEYCDAHTCNSCPYSNNNTCMFNFCIDYLNKHKLLSESNINTDKIDFNNIKDGEHFIYKGIEFIRLGKEQGGILCITAKIWKTLPFDKDGCNNFEKASICKVLNNEFRPLLDDNDLLTYQMDLTADNGDSAYGSLCVYAGLLSTDLYRKYRDCIPSYDDWIWFCTPWYCSNDVGYIRGGVYKHGELGSSAVTSSYGVVPAVIFEANV